MPTLLAAFTEPKNAVKAAGALLDHGVQKEHIDLLAGQSFANGLKVDGTHDEAAEKMCYNKTRVFDPSVPMKAKGHMFETTKQEQMRQEHYFMTERAKRPFSSKPRQPFQAGGSYKPRWAGGAFEVQMQFGLGDIRLGHGGTRAVVLVVGSDYCTPTGAKPRSDQSSSRLPVWLTGAIARRSAPTCLV